MIIVFLKYASTRKVHEPKVVKEVEKPVAKEVTKETHVVHDTEVPSSNTPSIAEALGESLG